MRFLILSDIHGDVSTLQRVLAFYDAGHYDMLLLLGDLLNYGPRNGVPEHLDAPGVVEQLSRYAGDIVAVRGNCDSEVDQMLLPFPMMGDMALVCDGRHRIFLTHGHHYNEERLPEAPSVDLFLYGHTHLWTLQPRKEGRPAIGNPGSPTFPKGGRPATFATLEDGVLAIRTLEGDILAQQQVY